MADYIRRDLAKKRFSKRLMWLKEDVHDEYSGALLDGCETDIELLDEIPAADVAEVVRCRDCKHAERYEQTDGTAGYYCGHPRNTFTYGERWDRTFKPVKEADEFCSYGERREE